MPFTPPRQPLQGADPQAALRTMLKMPSISNVSALPDSGLDIATGMDAFEPSEQELIDAQLSRPATASGSFAQPSREALRDQAMSKVKALLGMDQIKHQQRMQQEALRGQMTAQQFAAQQAGLDRRAQMSQAGQDRRDNPVGTQWVVRGGQAIEIPQGASQPGDTPYNKPTTPTSGQQSVEIPATMEKELAGAREGYGGTMSKFARFTGLGSGGRERYEGALTSWLSRAGRLDQLTNVINAAKQSGQGLGWVLQKAQEAGRTVHPYEQEYLQLVLGD